MKHLSILLLILLFSQVGHCQIKNNVSYDSLWKEVSVLEEKSLTKSALEVVKTISKKAKKEENLSETIKALLYSSKYIMILEEDSQLTIINEFKSEIANASVPTRNILESYLANLYWQYYQQNRFQLYNRTKTEVNLDSTDFRTWDLSTLFEKIRIHFERSLRSPEILQKLDITIFKDILNQQKNSQLYRPTLYDVLAHTALEFYKTSESDIINPSYKFEMDEPEYFSNIEKFCSLPILVKDNNSLQVKALKLYQQLLKLHQKGSSPLALVEVDLERLQFIKQHAVIDKVDEYYLDALKNGARSNKDDIAALYNYEIAALYDLWANNYLPKTAEEHQWRRKQALEICNDIINKYPQSRAAEKSLALKTQILSKNLQLTAEGYLPINQPTRILVHYKNIEKLNLTAHIITAQEKTQLEKIYPLEKQRAYIKRLVVAKQWTGLLKNVGDYQNHSTEILLPSLLNGSYVVLAESDSTISFQTVQVTDLAIIETRGANEQKFQVINRNNGHPISGAELGISYQLNYNGPTKEHTFITDKQGFITIPLSDIRWTNVSITVISKKDRATFGTFFLSQSTSIDNPSETTYYSSIFTDRSIYRPGQIVFFKGIAFERKEHITKVLKNRKTTAVLRDANNQEVGRQEYKTNDYGSFNGQFILPNYGLTGEYSISISSDELNLNGYSSISVEEYKRPKFETSFAPVTESHKVNDSITVTGKATAFAGSSISNAKVVYTVRRVVQLPQWYYWSRPYIRTSTQEIAHGATQTNQDGNYNIRFKALPDKSIPEIDQPIFSYEVSADVTDINGETHSTTTVVRVGYHSLLANIKIAPALEKSQNDHSLEISTTNLNGQEISAKGTVKIYKLKGPDHVLRERPWEAPEFSTFTKQEFKELFPHDSYSNENDPNNWEKEGLVWQIDFDTEKTTKIPLNQIHSWKSGKYIFEMETEDSFGNKVKDVVISSIFSSKDKQLADNQLFSIKTNKEFYTIGEKAKITLTSSAKNIQVTLFIEKDKKNTKTIVVPLSDNSKTISIPIEEDDLGGFAIRYSFSAYNGFVNGTQSIPVPYPSALLELETITFRDKLAPGKEEKWSFKIKGANQEKVIAEVLASMYDASLDLFKTHNWDFNPILQPTYYSIYNSNAHQSFGNVSFYSQITPITSPDIHSQEYDGFNWFDFYFASGNRLYSTSMMMKNSGPIAMEDSSGVQEQEKREINTSLTRINNDLDEPNSGTPKELLIRKNLQETAFFYPNLTTDSEGNLSFSFETPEALTEWKLQILAHTPTLESIVKSYKVLTQKELMVTPNAPRFLREGDTITISSKISNLTVEQLTGKASILLQDALNGKDITNEILISSSSLESNNNIEFNAEPKNGTQVSWTLIIPKNLQAIQYTVIAEAGNFSDGEQNTLPVLTNRMMVTETLPMWVSGTNTKTFTLEKLKETTSSTRSNHKLTLEITSNPAWYAIQALPYLIEYPYECNEQIFAKLYANTLANHIVKSNPNIKSVFDQWANTNALVSNLEKNQELKSRLIQETPWLRDAQTETEQKKRIALLFNSNQMYQEQRLALDKLFNNQMSNGSWAWFIGGPSNRYITQHILMGIGRLKKMNVAFSHEKVESLVEKGIEYLDAEFVNEYEEMKKYSDNITKEHLSTLQIHYLYTRSFFKDIPISPKVEEITQYYLNQARRYWTKRTLYEQGMLAVVFQRATLGDEALNIIKSLKENSITSEELGMYWKENTASWYWHKSPIETQALIIEAFSEIGKANTIDYQDIELLKIWLLKNKQTNSWDTTKATTDAIYAILLQGNNWLSLTDDLEVQVGGSKIGPWNPNSSKNENTIVEAGSGYYKTSWSGNEIKPKMAEIQLSKKDNGTSWGTLYWQYFEEIDKITPSKSPLQLERKLFLKKNTVLGEELQEINSNTHLNVGNLITTRILIKVDRDMEFVHLKDMRAAGLEPLNVLSNYKWQDGLGYYESTKDASTNFFFDVLPKGIYVFEYDLRVNNPGVFSNGISTIQSMYAPEFSSHSQGMKIHIME